MRVEASLAPVDTLQRAKPPRTKQRCDPCGPGPLAHPVEALAVLYLVAIPELLVPEDVAVGVHDPLREPRRAGCVVELRRVIGGGIGAHEIPRGSRQCVGVEHQDVRRPRAVKALRIVGVGDEQLRSRVREAMLDSIVAVQHGHGEQDRAELPDSEENGSGLGGGRQDDGNSVALRNAVRGECVRGLVRKIL